MTLVDHKIEKREILNAYRRLVQSGQSKWSKSDKIQIRHAFEIAADAHKDMRRKDGAPYILHPIAVAQIVAREIGLGPTSIICALLHDVVEDTEWTLEDIEREFDKKIASIIDGLTKISGVFDLKSSAQAENFRKLLLTLADDVRVILIKLADRLHNMRTMDEMPRHKQLKISSETLFLYAPLAHRLGLYSIKTELEDLGMKYTEDEMYKSISGKLQETKTNREKYIRSFIRPLKREIGGLEIPFKIFGRSKHIYSIFNKIKTKDVTFEEVYDLFAIRIILESPLETEKADCWRVYSLVTDHYVPKPDRLRDWISTPKANGYESLHTTVMGPQGRWVEVQIRSKRMDEIAEKGFAAHFKYKEGSTGASSLDSWLVKIRELLQNPESNALDFINDFKLDLFEDEIYIFTPKGELKRMAVNSTALDFAYEIHTDIGNHCIGAKVNHKLVPLSHTLSNGDQVEIITSNKQKPSEDWLNFVTTTRARARIKSSLKDEMRSVGLDGKAMLERKFRAMDIPFTDGNIDALLHYYHLNSRIDLYYQIAIKKINFKDLKLFENRSGRLVLPGSPKVVERLNLEETIKDTLQKNAELIIFGETSNQIDYKLAPCCSPLPGDDVFGFITISDGIKIHKTSCPNAVQLMSKYGYRIVKTKWTTNREVAFLTAIKINGIDDVGVTNKITQVISNDLKVNMKSISFESKDGVFEGMLTLYVNDTKHLDKIIKEIKSLKGIISVSRID